MGLIALTLLLRTYADVWMVCFEINKFIIFIHLLKIQTSTGIEASIIARKRSLFWKSTMHYLMCMPLVSVVNSFLKVPLVFYS